MKRENNFIVYIVLFILVIDIIVWSFIFFPKTFENFELYFLSVGQGDSSLILLNNQKNKIIKILIDGGPLNGNLSANLERVLGIDRYIDLVFLSHPQIDHFGGLIDILKNYNVGAFLYNGEEGKNGDWAELNRLILHKNIPKISLKGG